MIDDPLADFKLLFALHREEINRRKKNWDSIRTFPQPCLTLSKPCGRPGCVVEKGLPSFMEKVSK